MKGDYGTIFFYILLFISLFTIIIYCFYILIYSIGIKDAVLISNSGDADYYISSMKTVTLTLLICNVLVTSCLILWFLYMRFKFKMTIL